MAKNLMYEICKMLGVELFEEFKVVHKIGWIYRSQAEAEAALPAVAAEMGVRYEL